MPIQNLCPMCFFFLSCLRVIVLFSTIKDTYGKLLLSFDIFLSQCKKTFSGNKNKIQPTFISEDSSYHFFFFFLGAMRDACLGDHVYPPRTIVDTSVWHDREIETIFLWWPTVAPFSLQLLKTSSPYLRMIFSEFFLKNTFLLLLIYILHKI